jgi:hypothetical protein
VLAIGCGILLFHRADEVLVIGVENAYHRVIGSPSQGIRKSSFFSYFFKLLFLKSNNVDFVNLNADIFCICKIKGRRI